MSRRQILAATLPWLAWACLLAPRARALFWRGLTTDHDPQED